MRITLFAAALAAAALAPGLVAAGPIGNACMASDRSRGDAALCRCIQAAADATLNRGEQRRAARFFRDPHQAQTVRASTSAADNAFWQRYVTFGQLAEARCAG
ncbi:MAG: hypothetical protein ACK4OP_06570 [Gemmobacter sp.]